MSVARTRERITHLTALAALLVLCGCGEADPPMAPLEGRVTVDGKPLAGAAILFAVDSGGRLGQAVSDEDGRFEVWTFERGDGALVGQHRVSVTHVKLLGVLPESELLEGDTSKSPIRTESKIPRRYGHVDTSGITVDVIARESNFAELGLSSR